MFVTNWISTTKIQKISEITNFFRHYFLSRTEVLIRIRMKETYCLEDVLYNTKRYFTLENGVVSGTELAQEDFNAFLGLASRLGYNVVKL